MMSRFPKLTETFILYEILALRRLGLAIEIFPLRRVTEPVAHPEAERLAGEARVTQPLSAVTLAAHLGWLRRAPIRYARAWGAMLWGNRHSPKFLVRAVYAAWVGAAMAREMEALGVRHIHAHWATHPTAAAHFIHRLTGIPYSFTAHAHDLYVNQTMLAAKLAAAAFAVTISEHNRAFLRRRFGAALAAKVRVVRCGVDTDRFQPPARPAPPHPFTIVCVGRLEPKKGQAVLIDACRHLAASSLDFRCLIVGDGPERPRLEAAVAAAGLDGPITFAGRLTTDAVRDLLARADAMALPSVRLPSGKQEGIPVALMEAMAMGLPVVASRLSGIPELVEDGVTGLTVPERDPAALAAALQQLHADPDRARRLGAGGRARVLEAFDLHQNAAALYALLTGERPPTADGPAPQTVPEDVTAT